jgi:hypothetical protein
MKGIFRLCCTVMTALPGFIHARQGDPASLDRLNDIVLPEPVPWWPPAPGWYLAAVVVFLALTVTVISLIRRRRATRYRREALHELGWLAGSDRTLPAVAGLLKRTAMTAFAREQTAALSGDAWVGWLNGQCARPVFEGRNAELLTQSVYRGELALNEEEKRQLIGAAKTWITAHRVSEPC